MMLAEETLHDLPDSFWKNFCIALIVLLGVALMVISIWAVFRKSEPVKLKDDPAIEVRKAPKRFNHDLAEGRYVDHERRLLRLEDWRIDLIQKLEDDKNEILKAGDERRDFLEDKLEERHDVNVKRINRLMLAVARLCGQQGVKMPAEGEEA